MKGTRRENFKNAVIAVLMGIVFAQAIQWTNKLNMAIGWFLITEVIWVFMTAYDEILRKRRASRKRR